jgi:hypothetical protein
VVQRQEKPATTLADLRPDFRQQILYYAPIAYTNYVGAVNQVRSEMIVKTIEEKEKKDPFAEIAMTFAGLLLPMIPAAILGPIAAETINGLVRSKMIPSTDSMFMHEMAEKHLSEKLTVTLAWVKTSMGVQSVSITGNTPLARLFTYLDGLVNVSAEKFVGLFGSTQDFSDVGMLGMAALLKNLAQNPRIYRLEVRTRADHFMDTIATASNLNLATSVVGEQLAIIPAYGRDRWAIVFTAPTTGAWVFKRWLSPDMAEVAQAMYASRPTPRIEPSMLTGTSHLPAPMREASEEGRERRVVKMDAWGRYRYAWVHLPGRTSGQSYIFERWIPRADESAVFVYDDLQTGGIELVNADDVHGKEKPTD